MHMMCHIKVHYSTILQAEFWEIPIEFYSDSLTMGLLWAINIGLPTYPHIG